MSEAWLDIPGWSDYQISSLGNLYNKKLDKMVTGSFRTGTRAYHLRRNQHTTRTEVATISAQRLVAMAFLGSSESDRVENVDGDRLNNSVTNLRVI